MESNDQKKYPRVLVISAASLNSHSATGITLVNLYKGWPLDKIAQVYCEETPPDHKICTNYMQFSNKDVPFVNIVRRIVKGSEFRRSSVPNVKAANANNIQGIQNKPTFLPGNAAAWADTIPIRLSPQFWQWVTEYDPEVIYSVLGSIRILDIVLTVSKKLSVPVVPHFMDDWPSTTYQNSLGQFFPRILLTSKLRSVLKRSPYRMAISELMAKEYNQRFGPRFSAFMNCIDTTIVDQSLSNNTDTLVLWYVGNVNNCRSNLLKDIAESALNLYKEGIRIKIKVFAGVVSRQIHDELVIPPVMSVEADFTDEHLKSVRKFADGFIHVDDFSAINMQYFRLSLSAKLPLYLSAGLPIFAYGPDSSGSIKYISNHDCGITVTERNLVLIKDSLRRLACSPELRQRLGGNCRQVAIKLHDASIERKRFKDVLSNSAEVHVQ